MLAPVAIDKESRRRAGKWLQQQRTARRVTVREIADVLGVSSQQVYRYEDGTNSVDDDGAQRLAALLGLPLRTVREELSLWVPPESGPGVTTLEAIEMDQDLDDEARAHFRQQYGLLRMLTELRRRGEDFTPRAAEIRPHRAAASPGDHFWDNDRLNEALHDYEVARGHYPSTDDEIADALKQYRDKHDH